VTPLLRNIFNVAGVIAAAIVFVCVLVKSKTNPDAAALVHKAQDALDRARMHNTISSETRPLKRSRDFT